MISISLKLQVILRDTEINGHIGLVCLIMPHGYSLIPQHLVIHTASLRDNPELQLNLLVIQFESVILGALRISLFRRNSLPHKRTHSHFEQLLRLNQNERKHNVN